MVGRVNCWLIEDDPLTLVDTGPNSGLALDRLEQALREHGHALADLELIVVSHQHIDHLGLVDVLARRAGAEVATLDLLAPYLEDFSGQAEEDDVFAERLMVRHGIAPEVAQALRSVSRAFRGWGAGTSVTRRLADGGELALRDRTFRVLHRPGHSPSDTVLWAEDEGLMIGADHLLAHISSNPLLTRPLPGTEHQASAAGERPRALVTYLDSLAQTYEQDVRVVLTGHGEPVTDHRALIDQRRRMHDHRARKIHGLLEVGALTAHEIAVALFGEVALTQAYLTLSEVLGHVDLLLADGRAREEDEGGVTRFAATGDG
jgi:glyoxylase-like metal-dependent hydrolase (beta-lactamase superfamily II)